MKDDAREKIEQIIERHRKLYENTHYGEPSTRHKITEDFIRKWVEKKRSQGHAMDSWIDVGCGAVDWSDLAEELDFSRFVRCDPGHPDADVDKTPIHDLSFSKHAMDPYDFVTCFDVLEHLPEDQIGSAVSNLVHVSTSREVLISVGTKPSRWTGLDGFPLHLTVLSPDEWVAKLQSRSPFVQATEVGRVNDDTPFISVSMMDIPYKGRPL